MTVATLVMPNPRAEMPGKQPLRLPIIAPKDYTHSHPSDLTGPEQANSSSVSPRVRLPPRSRTGCWTCRSRKVKCDENRPFCAQCSRLGHLCDYSPRLSFKDDTLRILERMADVSILGNTVWDPTLQSGSLSPLSSPGLIDLLPPFAILTTDEERERKAEVSSPGTYHVIVNPDSFSCLPEYSDDSVEEMDFAKDCFRRRSSATSSMISCPRPEREGRIDKRDPNIVILGRFEDSSHRSPHQWKKACLSPSISSDMTIVSSPSDSANQPTQNLSSGHNPPSPLDSIVVFDDSDEVLLSHFRDVVWKQLIQVPSSTDMSIPLSNSALPNLDIFEDVARTFRPLFHAMMAVSALSLARRERHRSIDALQHYQQAFPSLQTCLRRSEDLHSDGLFLTHFLLLIYEIAAAEPGTSNLWRHHMSRLLDLVFLRVQTFGNERFPYIVWWVCNIDLYALLSGIGRGEFLAAVIESHMLPGPESQLYPVTPDGRSVIYSNEQNILPAVLQLHHETFILATRLGFLASEFRHGNDSMSPNGFPHNSTKLYALRDRFKSLWGSSTAEYLVQQMNQLPQRPREMMQNSLSLYHACQIFSAVSMWPGQCLTTGRLTDEEIEGHTTVILQIAERIVRADRLDMRFIVFPLFMAGIASSSEGQKLMAMKLLSSMEQGGIGRNASTIRQLLQIVYDQQTLQSMMTEAPFDVNWVELIAEYGLDVLNFGL